MSWVGRIGEFNHNGVLVTLSDFWENMWENMWERRIWLIPSKTMMTC
jgi:hypothetical protein